MFKKKSIAILCTLSLLAMLPSLSFAKEDYSESLKLLGAEDQEVVVNIAEEAQGMVTKEQIEQIVEQAGDAKSITIHKVGKNTDDKIKPMYLSDVVKRVESSNNPTAAVQIISVPKGKTIKLTTTQAKKVNSSARVKASVSVGNGPASVGEEVESTLTTEISTTYTTEETWTGPAESSSYVSRIYYWTGFYDRGTWKVDEINWLTGKVTNTYTGSYTEPTHYIEWSRDFK
ncbi:hypothetical protein P4U99_07760 [Brevibacillus agri]|uniref:hypothetical protein n=1 Tax=Brevibacillus agri TaxID=51101 RepID=UPI0024BF2FC6|nr:hypothetical protein [Brevibacillus agri]MED1643085.1 hypothetical protein [Brevibacillus agri]MED1653239.1 hypothetical protein [Brevibacillus agri]MED1686509.1 hypothetical protein [Brevibacillus agri]MED1694319.1 hypothetical protein [Brevibacillus agri]MED1695895.1 hypothetical protein [Brevibacillus agri]